MNTLRNNIVPAIFVCAALVGTASHASVVCNAERTWCVSAEFGCDDVTLSEGYVCIGIAPPQGKILPSLKVLGEKTKRGFPIAEQKKRMKVAPGKPIEAKPVPIKGDCCWGMSEPVVEPEIPTAGPALDAVSK